MWLDESDLDAVLVSDGDLSPDEMNLTVAEQLRAAGPWGQRFPEPLFDGVFTVLQQKMLGAEQNHLRLRLAVPKTGMQLDAIAFSVDTSLWPNASAKQVHVAYTLDVNEYNGLRSVQLLVKEIRLL